ncbi:hypothetical protein ACFX2I_017035 [Malus domestica]
MVVVVEAFTFRNGGFPLISPTVLQAPSPRKQDKKPSGLGWTLKKKGRGVVCRWWRRSIHRANTGIGVRVHRNWVGSTGRNWVKGDPEVESITRMCFATPSEREPMIVKSLFLFDCPRVRIETSPHVRWRVENEPHINGRRELAWACKSNLIVWLKKERELLVSVAKLEVMKEGLSQVKDVLTPRSIGHKEVRHQESLVQKKLTKTLGHSSQCLFTLLFFYLYGHVRDIEVDVRGGVYRCGSENDLCLCMGRIVHLGFSSLYGKQQG